MQHKSSNMERSGWETIRISPTDVAKALGGVVCEFLFGNIERRPTGASQMLDDHLEDNVRYIQQRFEA